MRIAGKVYRWIIVSVVLQVIALVYLNYFFLQGKSRIKATMYEEVTYDLKQWSLKMPSDAAHAGVSPDGQFAAYISDGKVAVVNAKNKKTVKTVGGDEDEFTYCRWLPDRNMVICGLGLSSGGKVNIRIVTYDADADVERSYPELEGLPLLSEVVDIELSPLTNIVYFKVKTSDSKAKVYRFDIMDNLKFVVNIGQEKIIKETNYTDNLVYQGEDKRIYARDGKKGSIRKLSFNNKIVLLDIDSEDNVYVGELDKEGNVGQVLFGKINESVSKAWQKVALDKPAKPEDILITPGGEIFQLLTEEKQLLSFSDGSKYAYSGTVVEVRDEYFVTEENRLLKLVFKT